MTHNKEQEIVINTLSNAWRSTKDITAVVSHPEKAKTNTRWIKSTLDELVQTGVVEKMTQKNRNYYRRA